MAEKKGRGRPGRPGEEAKGLRHVVEYKKRLVHTGVLYFGFFVMGWVVGQRGAAFLDLLLVTDTDLSLGSILFTLAGLASIVGALVGGFVLDWIGRPLWMVTGVFAVNAATNSTLALCKPLALMSTLYFMAHFALSLCDVVVNPHLATLWPSGNSEGFIQGLHFIYSLGAVISPLATQPFLAPRDTDTTHPTPTPTDPEIGEDLGEDVINGVYAPNTTDHNRSSNYSILNATDLPPPELTTAKETRVFFALLISGLLCAVATVLVMLLMKLPVQKLKRADSERHENQTYTGKARKIYFAALVMLGVYNFLGSSVEDVFPHYLMTFVVRALDWSKSSGARITSVYWVGLSTGRLCGVGLVKVVSPTRIMVGCLTGMLTSMLVMLVAVILRAHWAVWIAAGAVGLSTSVLFPTGLIYAHQNISQLTGKVSALIFTTPMIAAMGNPPFLAFLMTRFHDLCYLYVFLTQTSLALVTFLLLHALAHKLKGYRCRRSSGGDADADAAAVAVVVDGVEMVDKDPEEADNVRQSFLGGDDSPRC